MGKGLILRGPHIDLVFACVSFGSASYFPFSLSDMPLLAEGSRRASRDHVLVGHWPAVFLFCYVSTLYTTTFAVLHLRGAAASSVSAGALDWIQVE